MKWLFLTMVLAISGCEDANDGLEEWAGCDGTILVDEDGIEVFDCQEYVVGHSGVACPRLCCETEAGATCALACPR